MWLQSAARWNVFFAIAGFSLCLGMPKQIDSHHSNIASRFAVDLMRPNLARCTVCDRPGGRDPARVCVCPDTGVEQPLEKGCSPGHRRGAAGLLWVRASHVLCCAVLCFLLIQLCACAQLPAILSISCFNNHLSLPDRIAVMVLYLLVKRMRTHCQCVLSPASTRAAVLQLTALDHPDIILAADQNLCICPAASAAMQHWDAHKQQGYLCYITKTQDRFDHRTLT